MAKRNSTSKARPGRNPVSQLTDPPRASGTKTRRKTGAVGQSKKDKTGSSDLHDILGRFSDALAIVETACRALEAISEDLSEGPAEILTLGLGLKRVRRVYAELDEAILALD